MGARHDRRGVELAHETLKRLGLAALLLDDTLAELPDLRVDALLGREHAQRHAGPEMGSIGDREGGEDRQRKRLPDV